MIERFKRVGFHFSHCRDAGVPEIPYAQDVLFVLNRSDEERYYTFCACNHSPYVMNVCLAAAAVSDDVLNMDPYDEVEARQIIARAILELCKPEDRCLFNPSVAEATTAVGGKVPETRESLLALCECPSCKKRCQEEGLSPVETAACG